MTDQFFGFANATDPRTLGLKPIDGVTKVAGMPRINIANYLSSGFGNMNDWHDNIHTFTSWRHVDLAARAPFDQIRRGTPALLPDAAEHSVGPRRVEL